VIKRCLAKDPAARWQSIQEARAGLLWLQGEPGLTAPRPAPVVKAANRSRMALIAGVTCAALGAAVAGWWGFTHRSPAATESATSAITPASTPAAPPAAPPVVIPAAPPAETPAATPIPTTATPATAPPIKKPVVKPAANAAATPATAPVIPPVSAPAATPPVDVKPEPKPTPFVAPPPKAEAPAPRIFAVPDGLPFSVRLAEDIPSDVEQGQALHFTVVSPLRIGAETIVPAGAKVTGVVVEGVKKKLIIKTKVTFRLKDVEAVDGSKLAIRAESTTDSKDGARSVAVAKMPKHAKEVAAPAGTEYPAYSSGAQSVKLSK
jgi:hypothetical protein